MELDVLYVDDERPNLDLFTRCFEDEFTVLTASSGPEALELLGRKEFGLLVSDQRMSPMSGLELLSRTRTAFPLVTRMLLTAYSDRELLLSAIREGGVHDYVLKPWQIDELGLRIRHGLERSKRRRALARAESERDALARDQEQGLGDVIGFEGGLQKVGANLGRIATSASTVLIRGESGTGKEVLAHAIHKRSPRAAEPFVRVNCAALAESLLESELFGHEAGAFSGATKRKLGRFELAHGGTLFLDEIGDISSAMQVRLLRVLQEREFERVGGTVTVRVDVRIIAATHQNLEEKVRTGTFRDDLYYRLQVVPLQVPPLRDRREDVPPLARHFARTIGRSMGKSVALSDETITRLAAYDWPGNVRELRNVVERAIVLADSKATLHPDDLQFDILSPVANVQRLPEPDDRTASVFDEIARAQAEEIRDALRRAGGSRAGAARLLGLPRTTLNDRLRKFGIT